MKKHKICIVGGGLTGLISALVLSERGLDIDLILENNTSKNKDLRVTAISEKNIEFLSTGFDLESLDLLCNLGLKRYKIPSGEINNLPYLRKISEYLNGL